MKNINFNFTSIIKVNITNGLFFKKKDDLSKIILNFKKNFKNLN